MKLTQTLLHQLNLPIVDLPDAMVTRWITWIWLFDFDVRHIPVRKHSGPESLSRRPADSDDDDDDCDSVEDCVDADLGVNYVGVKCMESLEQRTPVRFDVEKNHVESGTVRSLRHRTPEHFNV